MKNITPTTLKNINSFWKWFLNNEIEIVKALINQTDYNQVFEGLNRKLEAISKKIDFVIKANDNDGEKLKIIFTAHGNKKLFPKIKALKELAPFFLDWDVETFIKPEKDIEKFKNGLDEAFVFQDFELKTSQLYFRILDYNIEKKKLNILIFIKDYCFHFDNHFLQEAVFIILEEFVGEIALKKHINFVQLAQLPNCPDNLICLFELQGYIERLNRINKLRNTFF